MDRRTVTMAAMIPQRYAGPTARMWLVEGSPAPTANASRGVRNAMESLTATTGVTRQTANSDVADRRNNTRHPSRKKKIHLIWTFSLT